MELRCVTRTLGRWLASQAWLDGVVASQDYDLLFLQEVPQTLVVPKALVALPLDLLPLRDRSHCRP